MTLKRSLLQFLLVATCGTLLSGCGSKLTTDNLAKVTKQMSQEEVTAILGKPTKIDTQDITILSTTHFIYQQGDNEVTLVFINNKLISKSGSFGN